jgi:serine/threonine-protein kinase
MSNKIGRFEILSELAKSDSGSVYKASDPESGQTLALKVIRLDVFGEHADEVVEHIVEEAETTKDLSSPNIVLVYGAGEIEGQFCAAMEYVQGNSIATMLARKEGFSIWDLLDISRQVCQGLEHAHEHSVYHYSLEPAKVMVTWDGTVKLLSFGISSAGYVAAQAAGFPPAVLHYMSPEQVRGEKLDARSNLFTWGAMLYEMVTDHKAFPGDDADAVRQKILEAVPVAPSKLNPKINAVASQVIMKAIAKDPEQRYQSGREMVADLERCREAAGKGAKKSDVPKGATVGDKGRSAAAMGKFAAAPAPKPAAPPVQRSTTTEARDSEITGNGLAEEVETSWSVPVVPPARNMTDAAPNGATAPAAKKAAAAAASSAGRVHVPSLDPSAQFTSAAGNASLKATEIETTAFSESVMDEAEVETPKIAIDPMMAEDGPGGVKGPSFSELEELPPLKEMYVAPPSPKTEEPPEEEAPPALVLKPREPEKPKVDPREVAEKALKEIKAVPPKLMLYSVVAAVCVVLVIAATVLWRNYTQSTDEEGSVPKRVAVQTATPAAAPPETAAAPTDASTPAPAAALAQPEAQAPEAQPVEERATPAAPAAKKRKDKKKGTPTAVAAVVAGELVVDSTPQGAQLQVDGRAEAGWVTPFDLAGLAPGAHTIVVSKSGYGQETRTVEVSAGSKSSLAVHLTALNSVMNVASDPPGASIFVDGKDTGHVTPAQITIEKGAHTVLVRKAGYLDETTSANGQPGQSFRFAPTLRALGNADGIKTVGKFKKIFGGNGAQAGMGKVSVRTTPKGAQIAVNRRMLDKTSPVEFLLNPGNYVIDITATGYKPLQKVITVEQDGSVTVDETLQPE